MMSRLQRLNELRGLLRRSAFALSPSQNIQERSPSWPLGGLSPGEISEWIAVQDGTGAVELALAAVRLQLPAGSRSLIVDPTGEISPLALDQRGWDLSRIIFVPGRDATESLWAVEQGLRSRGVDLVFCRFPKLTPVAFRRLKIAAEVGKARCLLLRGAEALRETSYADVRFLVTPLPSPRWWFRQWRLEILRVRNGLPGQVVQVERDDETGAVRVVSELANAADHRRAAGA